VKSARIVKPKESLEVQVWISFVPQLLQNILPSFSQSHAIICFFKKEGKGCAIWNPVLRSALRHPLSDQL
jgi:hypothetical protein